MNKPESEVNYGDYLQLGKLLDAQKPLVPEAHDEMLFIIVHQAYELWFKQVIHELDSMQRLFSADSVAERDLSVVSSRLQRVGKIQQIMVDQIAIMETMTPLDFLDFRDALTPASGFQSLQFREFEVRFGMQRSAGLRRSIFSRLRTQDQARLNEIEDIESVFVLVDRWLARMPFLQEGHFGFWKSYRETTMAMLDADTASIENHQYLTELERTAQLAALEESRETFRSLFDEEKYQGLIDAGLVRFSQKAMLAALFINLYRDEPILHLPFRILTSLVEIDEQLNTWRHRHVSMVHRMLGSKIGTGGSAGSKYLKKTTEGTRIFEDLFNISTYLIPRSKLPTLPAELKRDLDFHFSKKTQ